MNNIKYPSDIYSLRYQKVHSIVIYITRAMKMHHVLPVVDNTLLLSFCKVVNP